jgi:hypothetical protein
VQAQEEEEGWPARSRPIFFKSRSGITLLLGCKMEFVISRQMSIVKGYIDQRERIQICSGNLFIPESKGSKTSVVDAKQKTRRIDFFSPAEGLIILASIFHNVFNVTAALKIAVFVSHRFEGCLQTFPVKSGNL